jgi:hypothetical protein
MQTDDIRIVPWIPTIRLTTVKLMLACSAIGIVIGSLTTEKIVDAEWGDPNELFSSRNHQQLKLNLLSRNRLQVGRS